MANRAQKALAARKRDPKKEVLGKSKTAHYKPQPIFAWGQAPRELPLFNFPMIYAMLWDPTVRLGLAMREAPIVGAEFAYKDGETWVPGVKCDHPEVADFVWRQLQRIWKYDIHHLARAQIFGWSACEVLYKLTERRMVEVDRLLPRNAMDCRALEMDSELVGVRFRRIQVKDHVDLPFPKCIWHAYKPQDGKFYGDSVLRGPYSPWADKNLDGMALDIRRLYMHKDAYSGRKIGYPMEQSIEVPGSDGDSNNSKTIYAQDIAKEIVEQSRAGNVLTYPLQYDENGNQTWKIEEAVAGPVPTHILDFPKQLDVEILRGLEIPDDVLTAEASGAWAGKLVPMQAFYNGLDTWLGGLIGDVVRQVMENLVYINYGRAVEFEVCHKPLAIQSMETNAKMDSKGDSQQGGMSNNPNIIDLPTQQNGQQHQRQVPGGYGPQQQQQAQAMALWHREAETAVRRARRAIKRMSAVDDAEMEEAVDALGSRAPRQSMDRVFVYGTLRNGEVEEKAFGRDAEVAYSHDDSLPFYAKVCGSIDGEEGYCNVVPGEEEDVVDGKVLLLSDGELQATDEWEEKYERQTVRLASGVDAFVYVLRADVVLVPERAKKMAAKFDESKHKRGQPDNAGQFGPGGNGKKKDDKSSATKKQPRSVPKQKLSEKAERAKAAHVMVDKTIQRYSEEHNEPKFAKAVKGVSFPNGEPIDVAIPGPDGKVAHGVELKTMVINSNNKITMKRSAMERKAEWERKNKAPVHTVVLDDSAVFNANGEGQHDETKRRIFYRRGYGSFRVGTMHEVKDLDELQQLMDMDEKKLPPAAARPAGQKQGRMA